MECRLREREAESDETGVFWLQRRLLLVGETHSGRNACSVPARHLPIIPPFFFSAASALLSCPSSLIQSTGKYTTSAPPIARPVTSGMPGMCESEIKSSGITHTHHTHCPRFGSSSLHLTPAAQRSGKDTKVAGRKEQEIPFTWSKDPDTLFSFCLTDSLANPVFPADQLAATPSRGLVSVQSFATDETTGHDDDQEDRDSDDDGQSDQDLRPMPFQWISLISLSP